ncbi:potassium/sodium hyperpolarization-activated cyclic nucleotide-gated channel 1 [Histomonas meleagridis]|uniref:potassium/sodium hyperpolarization-activated cyclic nucleotide-gated channel 1 n=1 Tax=Histomonas meleagridis TaxID=135588 RepID=UPI003559B71F|nr:potassium/sodium hyperpolarization-activated cyclic nucleotide-gated channel 1 [Histomonas meleagridis]KAH0804757.1 potassium/sodium hyperpolarization-activated cyclic nucleotide-gated channel 1 [Histomonas meleagridis]
MPEGIAHYPDHIKKPNYWELLTEEDQVQYIELQKKFSTSEYKNRRNKSKETFQNLIDQIKGFVVRNDGNVIQRSLVCGIVWLEHGIAINTHQLCLLTGKCKSSINGSFQSIGYGTIPVGTDSSNELINTFPFLKNNFPELRQWTIRQKIEGSSGLSDESPAPNGFEESENYHYETSVIDVVKKILSNKSQSLSLSAPPPEVEKIHQIENEFPSLGDDPFSAFVFETDFDAFGF